MNTVFDFVQTIHRLDAERWGAGWGLAVTPSAIAGETPDEALASGMRLQVVPFATVAAGTYDAGTEETLRVGGMLLLTLHTQTKAQQAVARLCSLARPGGRCA